MQSSLRQDCKARPVKGPGRPYHDCTSPDCGRSNEYFLTASSAFEHITLSNNSILPSTVMPANLAHDLLLITCASGKQASNLLPLLTEWKRLRLVVHTLSSKERLEKQYPQAEVIQTDLYSPTNCAQLMKDVTVVIHVGPSYHPHETEIGYMMIDAALSAHANGTGSLKHFILSSVLNTQLRKMMNHDCKRYIEEYVIESGLPYTILQPTTFMDNLPWQMLLQEQNPKLNWAWSKDVKFSWIALRDLAAVMKKVLEERDAHFFAQYPLVSTHEPISCGEVMSIVSKKIGKDVQVSVSPSMTHVACGGTLSWSLCCLTCFRLAQDKLTMVF
jgi:uncharacterized protein YbjT (DUF2867 family)